MRPGLPAHIQSRQPEGSVDRVNPNRGAEDQPQPDEEVTDLQTQFEALLHQVWSLEARWRQEERIDLAVRRSQDL